MIAYVIPARGDAGTVITGNGGYPVTVAGVGSGGVIYVQREFPNGPIETYTRRMSGRYIQSGRPVKGGPELRVEGGMGDEGA
jgi:hypothetical protein